MNKKLTYREYVKIRLGDETNELKLIGVMLRRSLGASTFAGFWRYWNPLFGYYLYYNCYKPLSRSLPRFASVILTFSISGAVHDTAASLVLFKFTFLLTPVFSFWGLLIVAEEVFSLNYEALPVWMRAATYTIIIGGSIWGAVAVKSAI